MPMPRLSILLPQLSRLCSKWRDVFQPAQKVLQAIVDFPPKSAVERQPPPSNNYTHNKKGRLICVFPLSLERFIFSACSIVFSHQFAKKWILQSTASQDLPALLPDLSSVWLQARKYSTGVSGSCKLKPSLRKQSAI